MSTKPAAHPEGEEPVKQKTYLAISAHVGDGALTAGPLLAEMASRGHRCYLLDLTPGERGHPRLTPAEYRKQKLREARIFAEETGITSIVFDDLTDGFLDVNDDVAARVAEIIRDVRPDAIITHWTKSIHTDHENASQIAQRARFLAGLPGGIDSDLPRHSTPRFFFAENWEDQEGFVPDTYVPIDEESFQAWLAGISSHAFARGETYGFRYIDYYSSLMAMRGALAGGAGFPRAIALAEESSPARVALEI